VRRTRTSTIGLHDKRAAERQNPRMTHPSIAMRGAAFLGSLACLWGALPDAAMAQGESPQQRYERQLAMCNSGQLPDPQRNACVRDAGRMLDQSLGGTPRNVTTTTPDGRATVVNPNGLPVPNDDDDVRTSRDGRATIVLPADQPVPGDAPK